MLWYSIKNKASKNKGRIFMKRILCYGDSNTYGYNPKDGSRYNKATRWTALLAKFLSNDYEVIEEGCNNRTGFVDNPCGLLQSAQKHLPVCLNGYQDIDLIILSIGTNDLQISFHVSLELIERGLLDLILTVKKFNPATKIIIIPPVILGKEILTGSFSHQFDLNSINKSKQIGFTFKQIAQKEGYEFVDFNEFVWPSKEDGLHYDKEAHLLIAKNLAEFIEGIR